MRIHQNGQQRQAVRSIANDQDQPVLGALRAAFTQLGLRPPSALWLVSEVTMPLCGSLSAERHGLTRDRLPRAAPAGAGTAQQGGMIMNTEVLMRATGGIAALAAITGLAVAGCGGNGAAHHSQQSPWYQRGYQFGSQALTHGYDTGAAPMVECVSLRLGINGSPWSSTAQMPDGGLGGLPRAAGIACRPECRVDARMRSRHRRRMIMLIVITVLGLFGGLVRQLLAARPRRSACKVLRPCEIEVAARANSAWNVLWNRRLQALCAFREFRALRWTVRAG